MESAGAPTAVVTPFGDTPTSSGAIDVGTTDEVDGAVGDGVGAGPVADEHPDRIEKRKRVLVLTLTGKLTVFLKKFFPSLADKLVHRHYFKNGELIK